MSLSRRLTLTALAAALVAAFILGGGALFSTRALFDHYVQRTAGTRQQVLVDAVATYYRNNGSWQGVDSILRDFPLMGPGSGVGGGGRMMGPGAGAPGPGGSGGGAAGGVSGGWNRVGSAPGRAAAGAWALLDENRKVVARSPGTLDPGSGLPAGLRSPLQLPVRVDGRTVGHLLLPSELSGLLGSVETEFRRSILTWILVSALVALGLGVLAGWLSSAGLRRRANALALAAAALGGRRFEARVEDTETDELGQVASSFNRMAAELERSEQARRHLLADVAHELRTPLAVLRGQLELLQDGVTQPDPATLGALNDDVLRLGRLVGDLEQLSLAEAGRLTLHWQAFTPGTWLGQEVEVFREAAADQGVRLSLETSETLPTQVEGDPDRLGQVVANLLSNAFRHTPPGGTVTVAVGARPGGWGFTVRDTGEGISPEDLPHVFDRFYRAPRRSDRVESPLEPETRRGSGLGLAIVKGLVEAHGGRVTVESQPGQGSAFAVWLPLRAGAGGHGGAPPRPAPRYRHRSIAEP